MSWLEIEICMFLILLVGVLAVVLVVEEKLSRQLGSDSLYDSRVKLRLLMCHVKLFFFFLLGCFSSQRQFGGKTP